MLSFVSSYAARVCMEEQSEDAGICMELSRSDSQRNSSQSVRSSVNHQLYLHVLICFKSQIFANNYSEIKLKIMKINCFSVFIVAVRFTHSY